MRGWSEGWSPAGVWNEHGGIVTAAAGGGYNAVAPTVILSREIPAGARVWLQRLFLRVADQAAYEQIVFGLRLNGGYLTPFDKITGEQISESMEVDVEQEIGSGLLEVVARNMSGTTEPGASLDALAIRCVARFKGKLLRESARGNLVVAL